MFKLLGNFVARHWTAVILLWIAAAAGLHHVAPDWDSVTNDGDLAYLPDRMTTVRGERLLAQAFPDNKGKSQIVLICAREDKPLSADDLQILQQLATQLSQRTEPPLPVVDVWTPSSEVIGKKLVSHQGRAALAVLVLSTEFMAIQNIDILSTVEQAIAKFRRHPDLPAGLQLGVSGSAGVGGDMLRSAAESIKNTELITVLLVITILILVYRAPVLMVIPLFTLVTSVVVACDLVALLTQVHQLPGMEWLTFKVFKTSKIFIVTILFGSGTDFCLFLIARYREELGNGLQRREALAAALGNVGDAITASAMTTICGLSMMFFADFGKYRNSGPAIALCLAVALLACLTLAPALLRAFGRVVFWPTGLGKQALAESQTSRAAGAPLEDTWSGRFWAWISRGVVARPGLILVGSVLLLSPLAWQGWHSTVTYNLLAELEPSCPSVQGTDLLARHFPPGETGPLTILVNQPGAGFDTKAGEDKIQGITDLLRTMDGVDIVRSIAEPLGEVSESRKLSARQLAQKKAVKRNRLTRATYLTQVPVMAGDVTRLDVLLKVDPFSYDAMGVLDGIDERLNELADDPRSPWHGAEFDFLGTTAAMRDLRAVTQSDHIVIQELVIIMVLAILIVLLRRPIVCGYLILSVLFSYLVTLGATELAFTWYFDSFHGLDWKVPLFLFVILVAVGEDYNIYLVTRVVEEQKRHGLMEGLRLAIERTGGIITSCGVIMAGTFISMMAGTLRGMLELGFSLTLGVMLDTVVVRPILVPAFLALLYRRQELREQQAAAAQALAEVESVTDAIPAEALPHALPARKGQTVRR